MHPRIQLRPLTAALIIESPDPILDAELARFGIRTERLNGSRLDEDTLISAINSGGHQMLFKRSSVPLTRRVLEQCPTLMSINLCCIGDDSVDKQACADHGVMVFNDPVSNARSVVELVLGELILLARGLPEAFASTRAHQFQKASNGRHELAGRRLGLIGLGNIGRQVASAARAFGMEILFFDRRDVAREIGIELGYTAAPSIEALFRGADAVSVHVGALDHDGHSNVGLVTEDLLSQLGAERDGESPKLFINAARGVIHTSEALIAAVTSGAVRHAAVDVFPDEPRGDEPWTNPYADVPTIHATPHIGAATREAQPRIARRVAATAREFSRSGAVRDCVFIPRQQLSVGQAPGAYALAVVHSTARGTKKAVDDAIFSSGASSLGSVHRDIPEFGIAYDLSLIDQPFTEAQLEAFVAGAAHLTGDPRAIRSVRLLPVG